MTRGHCLCDYETLEVALTGSGPLNGLTFVIKDNIHVAGQCTGCGNPDWLWRCWNRRRG